MPDTTPPIELAHLKPSQLAVHPQNIRKDVGDVSDLADSLAAQGVQQPLKVAPNGKPDRYIVIAGHRRLAAAKLARLKTLPCVIDHGCTDPADQIAAMLAENIEREDLTAVEEAAGVELLLDLKLNQKEIASRTGMSTARVRSRVKVAKLSDDLKDRLNKHEATLADAEFIADHAGNDTDLADLENALGTNNWGVTKQKVRDRVAKRKRIEKLRKDIEASGLDVITDWNARRAKVEEAAKTLGVKTGELVRHESPWPITDDVQALIDKDSTVAFVHLDPSGSMYFNGRFVDAAVFVLAAPPPDTVGSDTGPVDTSDAGHANETDAADDGPEASQEPSPELVARRARLEAIEAATKVRRQFIRDAIETGNPDHALLAAQHAPEVGDLCDFEWFELLRYLPVEDPHPDVSSYLAAGQAVDDRTAAVVGWIAANRNPHSLLLAYTMQWWSYIDHALAQTQPVDYLAEESLAGAVSFFGVLDSMGYVLSDVEQEMAIQITEAADEYALQAAADGEADSDETPDEA